MTTAVNGFYVLLMKYHSTLFGTVVENYSQKQHSTQAKKIFRYCEIRLNNPQVTVNSSHDFSARGF